MKASLRATAALIIWFCCSAASFAAPKGHLVIIGGGPRPANVMEAFIGFAGGRDARFLVISNAGTGYGTDFTASLKALGIEKVEMIIPTREQCEDPEYVASKLDGVTGIFFSGGQQANITAAIRGTRMHERLKQLYEDGAVIGGTSAGAAMMSDPMMAAKHGDDETIAPNEKYNGIRGIKAGYMRTSGGMGFLQGAIIDQHFFKRLRQNRMFCVALDHPDYTTIGIDESTALIVSKGNRIEVMGESSVMVVKPVRKSIKTNKNRYYGARMTVRLLVEGDSFTI